MATYRQYENPRELEQRLQKAKERLVEAKIDYNSGLIDEDELDNAQAIVDELSDRVNFAWQDEEYDEQTRESI